jgi:hypothetical protein
MVMPLDSAKAMIESLDGVEALFVSLPKGGDKWQITATKGFPEVVR